MMGSRYFLDALVVDEPYGMIFSDEAYWSLDRWQQAQVGKIPRDLIIWFMVPSQLDPDLAPAGKQCILTGVWCPADPAISEQEKQVWWDKADEMMVRVWPELPAHLESQERYSTADVSARSQGPGSPRRRRRVHRPGAVGRPVRPSQALGPGAAGGAVFRGHRCRRLRLRRPPRRQLRRQRRWPGAPVPWQGVRESEDAARRVRSSSRPG